MSAQDSYEGNMPNVGGIVISCAVEAGSLGLVEAVPLLFGGAAGCCSAARTSSEDQFTEMTWVGTPAALARRSTPMQPGCSPT